jgi:UDP-N-acetylglucosamine 1-carboxyvinyltransferase
MDKLVIKGRKKLSGEVYINGAKNAAVAIIPAAIISKGTCVIDNLPDIEDVKVLVDAVSKLGAVCKFIGKHTIQIDSSNIVEYKATYESVNKIRASYYILGSLLGRFGKAQVPLPGGCNFGTRPIDQHIKGFEAMGAKVTIEHGMITAQADKLVGANIYLDVVSVGATINIMLAAVYAQGTTTIENAAKEPHVVDTANFLNKMGAKIKGAGTDTIRIKGVESVGGGEYTIIPDQIEAGTYMIASAITAGDVVVKNIIPKHMESLTAKLVEMNCTIEEGDDYIRVIGNENLKGVNVKTMAYPGFPTDLQPQMTALLCTAVGNASITESVWENRFQYASELERLGCHIEVQGRVARMNGASTLSGAEVVATDLRAGAALVVAALAAEGETNISNIEFIARGYEQIDVKLKNLGANIKIVKHNSAN